MSLETAKDHVSGALKRFNEGFLLATTGFLIPFIVAANLLFNVIQPVVLTVGMFIWIFWFMVWASKGGMPRMR